MSTPVTILDGGMSRELIRLGAPFQQPEWSALALIEAPAYVGDAHRAFIEAGATVITTNSYAVVPFHIGETRFQQEGQHLAARAGHLAREQADAAPHPVQVAGSLPPLFGSYEPEKFDPVAAPALLRPLVEGLAPYVDIWLAETLSSTAEARAVRQMLSDDARPLWISFTLNDTPETAVTPPTLRSGETIAEAVACINELHAHALLFNCSQAEIMESAIQAAHALAPDLAIGVYANAFVPAPKTGAANAGLSGIRNDLDPATYAEVATAWATSGATIIGGCCGIGSSHIAALAASLTPESPARPVE